METVTVLSRIFYSTGASVDKRYRYREDEKPDDLAFLLKKTLSDTKKSHQKARKEVSIQAESTSQQQVTPEDEGMYLCMYITFYVPLYIKVNH